MLLLVQCKGYKQVLKMCVSDGVFCTDNPRIQDHKQQAQSCQNFHQQFWELIFTEISKQPAQYSSLIASPSKLLNLKYS